MTIEEMEELKGLAASMGLYDDKNPCKRAVILGKAIKELEQEPCEDAVSRKFFLRDLLLKAQGEKDVSIKWLEEYINSLPSVTPQEPFKPMVEIDLYSVIKQKYIEREVLDKIRAEIEAEPYISKMEVLEIIDKYKAESENKE